MTFASRAELAVPNGALVSSLSLLSALSLSLCSLSLALSFLSTSCRNTNLAFPTGRGRRSTESPIFAPDILVASAMGAHYAEETPFQEMSTGSGYNVTKGVLNGSLVRGMLAEGKPVILVEAASQLPQAR